MKCERTSFPIARLAGRQLRKARSRSVRRVAASALRARKRSRKRG